MSVQERSLGHLQLPVPDPDRFSLRLWRQGIAGDTYPGAVHLLHPLLNLAAPGSGDAATGELSWQTGMRKA